MSAIGTAIRNAVVGGWPLLQMEDASLGLVSNPWILLLIYLFMLGIMGHWSKRPYVLFILLVTAIILIVLVDIAIQVMCTGFVRFHFRHAGGASFPTS
jgi:mixed-linked glucan synthase